MVIVSNIPESDFMGTGVNRKGPGNPGPVCACRMHTSVIYINDEWTAPDALDIKPVCYGPRFFVIGIAN